MSLKQGRDRPTHAKTHATVLVQTTCLNQRRQEAGKVDCPSLDGIETRWHRRQGSASANQPQMPSADQERSKKEVHLAGQDVYLDIKRLLHLLARKLPFLNGARWCPVTGQRQMKFASLLLEVGAQGSHFILLPHKSGRSATQNVAIMRQTGNEKKGRHGNNGRIL